MMVAADVQSLKLFSVVIQCYASQAPHQHISGIDGKHWFTIWHNGLCCILALKKIAKIESIWCDLVLLSYYEYACSHMHNMHKIQGTRPTHHSAVNPMKYLSLPLEWQVLQSTWPYPWHTPHLHTTHITQTQKSLWLQFRTSTRLMLAMARNLAKLKVCPHCIPKNVNQSIIIWTQSIKVVRWIESGLMQCGTHLKWTFQWKLIYMYSHIQCTLHVLTAACHKTTWQHM